MQTLYNVPVTDPAVSYAVMELSTNTSFVNEVRLTPDGSAYFMRRYQPSQGSATSFTALTVINGSGIKDLGKVTATEMQTARKGQFDLYCCRYFNGAYYALVYPVEETVYDRYSSAFRMELVKLTP